MLRLRFQVGDMRCDTPCVHIREVVPMMALKEMPRMPPCFAGFFNYRGTVVPVIDLCRLMLDRPCDMRLSTRIILTERPRPVGAPLLLGLIAERITETVRREATGIPRADMTIETAPYVTGISMERDQMIYHIDLPCLVSVISFPTDIPEPETS